MRDAAPVLVIRVALGMTVGLLVVGAPRGSRSDAQAAEPSVKRILLQARKRRPGVAHAAATTVDGRLAQKSQVPRAIVPSGPAQDVGPYIQKLGNPFLARYPNNFIVRNPWAMKVFNGRIYLGHGDLNLNLGPTDLWYVDPATRQFIKEYAVDDEAVEVFRECFGQLCVPGADASEAWDWGNFYRKEAGGWQKHRNLENGLHVSDLYTYRKNMFAAIWQYDLERYPCEYAGIGISEDKGKTWRVERLPEWGPWTFFTLGGRLYVQTAPVQEGDEDYPAECPPVPHSAWYVYKHDAFQPIFDAELFPETPKAPYLPMMVPEAVHFQGKLVYLGSDFGTYHPFAVWAASGIRRAERLWLPGGAVARDLLLHADTRLRPTLYVLASIRQTDAEGNPEYLVFVYSTQDLKGWQEVLHFTAPTFARSFAYRRGDFYFGMGGWGVSQADWDIVGEDGAWSEVGVHPAVGEIWLVSGRDIERLSR